MTKIYTIKIMYTVTAAEEAQKIEGVTQMVKTGKLNFTYIVMQEETIKGICKKCIIIEQMDLLYVESYAVFSTRLIKENSERLDKAEQSHIRENANILFEWYNLTGRVC